MGYDRLNRQCTYRGATASVMTEYKCNALNGYFGCTVKLLQNYMTAAPAVIGKVML